MRFFETSWRDGYEVYERYYDTDLGRSFKNKITIPYEWYEECSTGLYTSILDDSIRLEKRQGTAKQGRGHYGFLDPIYRNIRDNYWKDSKYNKTPRIWSLDIETRVGTCSIGFPDPNKALEPVSLIQIYDNKLNTMFVLGTREWKHENDYTFDYNVKYVHCKNEIHLLELFLDLFSKLDPLIIQAWNSNGFDYPYLYYRLKNLGLDENRLSNYGPVKINEKEINGLTIYNLIAPGHHYIDLMEAYKKFTFHPMPNYQLDTVAEYELNEKKHPHDDFNGFDGFYTGDYILPENPSDEQKSTPYYKLAIENRWDELRERAHSEFVYYGIKDTYLVERIDERQNLISQMIMIAEKMGVLISDSLGTVKPWSQYIANKAMLNQRVIPPKKEHNSEKIVGGFVRQSSKGKHKWVLSADVNSMYPLLGMVGFNMSSETFIPKYKLPNDLQEYIRRYFNNQDEASRLELNPEIWNEVSALLKKYNYSLGINGAVFNRENIGMIPELVHEIYKARKSDKSKMFEYQKRKILINELLKEKSVE